MRARLVTLALLLVAGCVSTSPVLVPDRPSLVTAGAPLVVVDRAGVRLTVDGDAWRADPHNLGEVMMPLLVTIENHSGRAIRIAYVQFDLLGGSGFRYPAIPPLQSRPAVGELTSPAAPALAEYHPARPSRVYPRFAPRRIHPRFELRGFFIAPWFAPFYPGFAPWPYAFPYEPYIYSSYDAWPSRLPTEDMLAAALPEGVVQDGGRVMGFLYFQGVQSRESHVQLEVRLIDAMNGQMVGTVSIPFSVRR